MLLVAAGPLAARTRFVTAREDVEFLDIRIGLSLDAAGRVEAPDLQCVVEGRARAVAQGIVEHHAKVGGHALGPVGGSRRRRERSASEQRAHVRNSWIVSAGRSTELKGGGHRILSILVNKRGGPGVGARSSP